MWNAPDELYDAALFGKEMSSKPQRKLSARGNTGLAGACGRAEVWVTRVATYEATTRDPGGGYPGRGSEARVDTTRLRIRAATGLPSGSGAVRNAPGCLQRNGDGEPDVRIAAIVEVVSIVVVDVEVVGVVPVFRPIFRIRIDQQERVAAVEKARISHVHNGASSHAEEVLAAETEIEAGLRNVVTAVASALLPGAMVGRPVLGAILLPGIFRLPTAALLYPSPLLLPRSGLLLVALGLNLRLRLRGALLLWLGLLGALRLLGLLSLRLLGTLLWLSLRLLGALLLLLLLRLGALLLLGLLRTLLLLLLLGLLGPLLRLWRTLLLGLLSTLLLRLRRPLLLLLGLLGVLLLLRLRRTLLLRLLRALLLLGLLGMLLLLRLLGMLLLLRLGALLLRGRPTLRPFGLALLVSWSLVLCVNGHHHSEK